MNAELLVIRLLLGLLLGFGEPGKERLGSLANLLRDGDVDISLGRAGSPLGHNLLGDEIVIVVELKDLGNLVVHLGLLAGELANQTLGTAEKGLLMLLRRNKLVIVSGYSLERKKDKLNEPS